MNQTESRNVAVVEPRPKLLELPQFKAAMTQLDAFEGVVPLVEPFAPDIKRMVNERDKKRFLKDGYAQEERQKLKEQVLAMAGMLRKVENASQLRSLAQSQLDQNEAIFKQNVNTILEAARPFERSYGEVEVYFRNAATAEQKVKNLTILHVNEAELLDHKKNGVFNEVKKLLMNQANRADQTGAYAILVIPSLWQATGQTTPKQLIERYMGLAGDARVCFLTDFEDVESSEVALSLQKGARWKGLMGAERKHSKLVMFVNHLKLRKAYTNEYGEEDDLHGSPAMAVAGKMYRTCISQPAAGTQDGAITGIDGLAFEVLLPEVNDFDVVGLNAMINDYGVNMAFNQRTAFNGKEIELARYAVVRLYDYIHRIMRHYLGKLTFKAMNKQDLVEIKSTIKTFFIELERNRVLAKGTVKYCEFDSVHKDKVNIDIELTPIWAVRTFEYKLVADDKDLQERK